jgi:chaperonin GroES
LPGDHGDSCQALYGHSVHYGVRTFPSYPSRGGIIIPDSAKDKPQEGEIISIGKGKTNDEGKLFPLAVKEGDGILFGKYSGTEIKIDGEDFLIMKEEEILGIITGAAKKQIVGAKR